MTDPFPYASEEDLKDGDRYYEEVLLKLKEPKKGFSKKAVIMDMIKKFKSTSQFFRINVPMIFICPVSMLELVSSYYLPTPSILSVSTCKSPEERMLRVVKWALANIPRMIHGGICHSKPYNPIIGEQLVWKWKHSDSETCCLGEQVSHHPPISTFYISNRKKNFSCRSTVFPLSKLYPNSFELSFAGEINFKIHNLDEEYILEFPPMLFYGILFGKQFSEHNGVYRIQCKKTNLTFLMLFKEKEGNKVMGRIIRDHNLENEVTLYKFSGKATEKILIKNVKTKKVSVFCNNTNPRFLRTKAHMRPLIDQKPNESRRNWHMVTKVMKDSMDLKEAGRYKDGIENVERAKRKKRNDNKEKWKEEFFKVKRSETVRVKKFKDEKEEDSTEEVKVYQCLLENRTPFEEGEEDPFENHEMFQF